MIKNIKYASIYNHNNFDKLNLDERISEMKFSLLVNLSY